MPSTIVLLHLDEPFGVLPSDAMGNLGDLMPDTGNAEPAEVSTFTGRGRVFSQFLATGLIAEDESDLGTLLQRDVTVQAILALNLATMAPGAAAMLARGVNDGSPSERYSLGLELEQTSAGIVEVRFFHTDSSDTIRVLPGGVFASPGDGKFFLLTATRRWEASDRVVVRYYVNDEMIAELVTVYGDIAGGTTGRTTIGGRKQGGLWQSYFHGTIDELSILDYEMSAEELREGVYRRLTDHQPGGVDTFAGLSPKGLDWYRDPGNNYGRRVKTMGQALGGAVAAIEELRELWLPDKATLDNIGEWEELLGASPRARESLDKRRARLMALGRRRRGFSLPAIREALAEPLDMATSQIEILEFSNEVRDDFQTLDTTKWLPGTIGTWSIVSSALHAHVNAATDIRWDTQRHAVQQRMPLDTGGGPIYVSAQISTSTIPINGAAGILLENRIAGDALWFGVHKDAVGTVYLGWRVIVGGVIGAFQPLLASPGAAPYWLRISNLDVGGGFGGATGPFDLSYSMVGPSLGFTTVQVDTSVVDVGWAGVSLWALTAAPATAFDVDFDDFLVYCPEGSRPFYWYAYADPAHGAVSDLALATFVSRKVRPAHAYAAATKSLNVMPDDPIDGLTDRGPLGAW